MKTILIWAMALCLGISITHAQNTQSYTVDGTSYALQTEVEGPLTLLWNIIDQEYRYFVKKGNTIEALHNTKTDDGYQEEYKTTLNRLTEDANSSTAKVKLTLVSLRQFVNAYNKTVDPNFSSTAFLNHLELRLGILGGITNTIFVANPNNESTGQAVAELELYDPTTLRRHSVVLQYKQTFSSSNFDFSFSQISLNYRFKFVQTQAISFYINTKVATLTISQSPERITMNNGDIFIQEGGSNTSFQGALLFGLGTDIKLGKGWLTLNYNDAYSFVIDDNGEFPVDITVGYRFKL